MKTPIRLKGTKDGHRLTVLVDTGARMSLVDKSLAERIGVEYTGRTVDFVSISGQVVKASEALVRELEIEGEILKYEAVAVAEVPTTVKETLAESGLNGSVVVGLLTLERANLVSDTTTGVLKKVGSFILELEPKTSEGRRRDAQTLGFSPRDAGSYCFEQTLDAF